MILVSSAMPLRPIRLTVVVLLLMVLTFNLSPGAGYSAVGEAMEVVFHKGDLILNGSRVFVIEDQVFNQKGDILVAENATLRLVGARLELMESDEKYERFSLVVSGNGRLEAEGSKIGENRSITIQLYDSAQAWLNGSWVVHESWCTIHKTFHKSGGLTAQNNSRIEGYGSRIGVVTLRGNASCHLQGSHLDCLIPDSSSSIFRNSTIGYVYFNMEDEDLEIEIDLKGHVDHWSSQEHAGWLPFDIEFIDSMITEGLAIWAERSAFDIRDSRLQLVGGSNNSVTLRSSEIGYLNLQGETEIAIRDSSVVSLSCWGLSLTLSVQGSELKRAELDFGRVEGLEITNCSVGQFIMGMPLHDVEPLPTFYITDTVLGNFTIGFGNSTPIRYIFQGVTITEGLDLGWGAGSPEGGATILGSLKFGENVSRDIERGEGYRVITRQYDVQASRDGGPGTGVEMRLLRGIETIWTGETDPEGRACFNATFADIFHLIRPFKPEGPYLVDVRNMTDTLTLVAEDGKVTVEKEIGLFSDTPVVLAFEQPRKPPPYGLVVAALVGVLIAFYLVSRKTRWL